jgi:hypothetical protein
VVGAAPFEAHDVEPGVIVAEILSVVPAAEPLPTTVTVGRVTALVIRPTDFVTVAPSSVPAGQKRLFKTPPEQTTETDPALCVTVGALAATPDSAIAVSP